MPDKKLTDSEIVNLLELLLDKIRAYRVYYDVFVKKSNLEFIAAAISA